MHRLAALLVVFVLCFAACGPDPEEQTTDPEESVEAVTVPDSVLGTYQLIAVDDEPLPGGVGTVDECEVQLSRGTLTLGDDARYELDVLARALCDDDEPEEAQMMDRATSEGPFTVDSTEIRFISAIEAADTEADDAEETGEGSEDEEMEEPDLFDAALFSGTGTLRDTTLTVRLDDVTTLTFTRE